MQAYLDNHSCTKTDERVFKEMMPFLTDNYGNAQSMHSLGAASKDAIERARGQVAGLIGAGEKEICFTASGSESNNLAIKGVAEGCKAKGRHIVISPVEHFSVMYSAKRLSQAGFEVTYVPVDKYGMVSPDDIKSAIRQDTVLVSIQHANPEIGTVQPIEEISKVLRERNIPFHTDAVATAGVLPVDVAVLGVDLLTFSASMIYGPKGVAALYIRKGVRIVPQIDGGIQENGRRAGTENVPAIVGFGAACEIAKQEMEKNRDAMLGLRNRTIDELPKRIDHIYLNGHPERRLPGNVNFSVEFIEGEGMLLYLDRKGIYITSGSACTSKALKMSHVLSAIKLDPAVAQGSLLMTLSKYNTAEEVEYLLAELPPIVRKLRGISPLYNYFLKSGKRHVAGPGTDYEHQHEDEVTSE
ncbi:MAG: cysteine desulfurase [Elusimicrobia bacterium]|nr:cysteine desulfurase [Elusimicrobiota bacterium]